VAWVRLLPGVSSADANTLTGSLMVRYDAAQTGGSAIVSALKEAGWIGAQMEIPVPSAQNHNGARSEVAAKIAEKIAIYTLERAAEISLRALFSALL
jgi:hypothetical protein